MLIENFDALSESISKNIERPFEGWEMGNSEKDFRRNCRGKSGRVGGKGDRGGGDWNIFLEHA